MITDFYFYYNNKCKHSTTKMTPREVLFNYKNKEMIESNYKCREVYENFYQEIDYDGGDSILITSLYLELSNNRIRTFARMFTRSWVFRSTLIIQTSILLKINRNFQYFLIFPYLNLILLYINFGFKYSICLNKFVIEKAFKRNERRRKEKYQWNNNLKGLIITL